MIEGPVGHVQYSSVIVEDFMAVKTGCMLCVMATLEFGLMTRTLASRHILRTIASLFFSQDVSYLCLLLLSLELSRGRIVSSSSVGGGFNVEWADIEMFSSCLRKWLYFAAARSTPMLSLIV